MDVKFHTDTIKTMELIPENLYEVTSLFCSETTDPDYLCKDRTLESAEINNKQIMIRTSSPRISLLSRDLKVIADLIQIYIKVRWYIFWDKKDE